MKILIAEDDTSINELLTNYLTRWGFEPLGVKDGNTAIEELQKKAAPYIAILDWMMPGLEGPDVCKQVKKFNRRVPIYTILLTAKGNSDDIIHGLAAGADDYITKPFIGNELKARINVARRMVDTQLALARKITELEDALNHVKTLHGVLPICMYCKKIRNDAHAWNGLENYVQTHSDIKFSHGICPKCIEKYYLDN